MSDPENQEGKRVGVHPLVVIFGVIIGLWIFKATKPKPKEPPKFYGKPRIPMSQHIR